MYRVVIIRDNLLCFGVALFVLGVTPLPKTVYVLPLPANQVSWRRGADPLGEAYDATKSCSRSMNFMTFFREVVLNFPAIIGLSSSHLPSLILGALLRLRSSTNLAIGLGAQETEMGWCAVSAACTVPQDGS
jgi:hypothetical protein